MITALPGFKITEEIARSHKSIIYRGLEEKQNNRPVILKIFAGDYPPPDELARYQHEHSISKKLPDNGFIRVYDVLHENNELVLVMQDAAASSLADMLRTRPTPIKEFLEIALRLTNILSEVHKQNIIHMDLNPRNILFNPENMDVRLIDFGISYLLSGEQQSVNTDSRLQGTLNYISPEQTGRMNRSVDYRSDYYSLGITFFEMLTGRLPFISDDPMELVHCHIAKQPPAPNSIVDNGSDSAMVSNIIMKLMSKAPEDRYQSASGLFLDLDNCLKQYNTRGRIENFELGTRDITDRFQIPEKLYGREEEARDILAGFTRVCEGNSEFLLITGRSGVGKSSLVNEVYKPLTQHKGYFLKGKFDQFHRDVPYSALAQAFQKLVLQLLTEEESSLARWKEKILASLGDNGQVLIDVIPNLEMIIGAQTAVPELPPAEAQNRFNLVFQNFIRTLAGKKHPLVIFLDDLQWADSSSFKLLQALLVDPDSKYLLLLGAYRNNEVDAAHPLSLLLEELEKQLHHAAKDIHLETLGEADISSLLEDTLHREPGDCAELSGLVMQKTNGNPFFVNEFLKNLYREGLLFCDRDTGIWNWKTTDILNLSITDNVIDLMTSQVQKLPEAARETMKLASCFGERFELRPLAVTSNLSPLQAFEKIKPAIDAGLILPTDDSFKYFVLADFKDGGEKIAAEKKTSFAFLHSRVHQAAYSLLEETEKQRYHLSVGRQLLKKTGESGLDETLIEITKHFNIGSPLLDNESEKLEVARLNLKAGRKAQSSTAYEEARSLFRYGMEILPTNAWDTQAQLAKDLYRGRAENEYLTLNFEKSEEIFGQLLEKSHTKLEKALIHQTRLDLYLSMGKLERALEIGLEGIRLLGLKLPKNPGKGDIVKAVLVTRMKLGGKKPEDLPDLPPMPDDESKTVLMYLLVRTATPAFLLSHNYFPIFMLKLAGISFKYGNSSYSSGSYMSYGVIRGGALKEYEIGYRFAEAAMELSKRLDQETPPPLIFSSAAIVSYWKNPVGDSDERLLRAYQLSLSNGDLYYVAASLLYYCGGHILSGGTMPLGKVLERMQKYETAMQKSGQDVLIEEYECLRQFTVNMTGESANTLQLEGKYFKESESLPQLEKDKVNLSLFMVYHLKCRLAYFFGEYPEALKMSEKADHYAESVMALILLPTHYFYSSLSCAAHYEQASAPEKKKLLKRIKNFQKELKKLADVGPANYMQQYLLVEGELARLNGKNQVALDLYEEATERARENKHSPVEALGYELSSRLYYKNNKEKLAVLFCREAYHAYEFWGARAKSKQLRDQNPRWLHKAGQAGIPSTETSMGGAGGTVHGTVTTTTAASTTGGFGASGLDLNSVLKASQTMSGEIVLEKLLEQMMRISIENAGAQRGSLVFRKDDKFVIEAESSVGTEEVRVFQSIPADEDDKLPISIINYVYRTRENLVLNDASKDERFADAPYIRKNTPRSVLCAPVMNKGKIICIIYLENNLATGAFTPSRLEVLKILTSQAAISIENASLYSRVQRQAQSFARFVPMQFLEFLEREKIEDVRLGDALEKSMTVLFMDIRSFTTLSESMTPQENFEFLNSLLGRLGPVIRNNSGFVDKYIGDAIMALFPKSTETAIQAGVEMQRAVRQLNKERAKTGDIPISIGIGIHTGPLMLGVIGEAERVEGTVIADAVNLASRLEGLTKEFGAPIIVSKQTLNLVQGENQFSVRRLGRVKVKGKNKTISIMEIIDGDDITTQELKLETGQDFERALEAFMSSRFEEARRLFKYVLSVNPDDAASALYYKRTRKILDKEENEKKAAPSS